MFKALLFILALYIAYLSYLSYNSIKIIKKIEDNTLEIQQIIEIHEQ